MSGNRVVIRVCHWVDGRGVVEVMQAMKAKEGEKRVMDSVVKVLNYLAYETSGRRYADERRA